MDGEDWRKDISRHGCDKGYGKFGERCTPIATSLSRPSTASGTVRGRLAEVEPKPAAATVTTSKRSRVVSVLGDRLKEAEGRSDRNDRDQDRGLDR